MKPTEEINKFIRSRNWIYREASNTPGKTMYARCIENKNTERCSYDYTQSDHRFRREVYLNTYSLSFSLYHGACFVVRRELGIGISIGVNFKFKNKIYGEEIFEMAYKKIKI